MTGTGPNAWEKEGHLQQLLAGTLLLFLLGPLLLLLLLSLLFYKILLKNSSEDPPLDWLKRKWENNMKQMFSETRCEDMHWAELAQVGGGGLWRDSLITKINLFRFNETTERLYDNLYYGALYINVFKRGSKFLYFVSCRSVLLYQAGCFTGKALD
jgi:hypothetical protein